MEGGETWRHVSRRTEEGKIEAFNKVEGKSCNKTGMP